MKAMNRIAGFLAVAAFLGVGSALYAQDPLKAAPDMYRLLWENERVRVMEVTFKPGQKIAEHSHPDHFVYVLEAGTLEIHKPAGPVSNATVKVGDVLWIPAETHWAVNTGSTTVRLVVNELKEPAPKPKKSK
jgi:beta-alanine degradation protein BauB